jgi:hypothetical protein
MRLELYVNLEGFNFRSCENLNSSIIHHPSIDSCDEICAQYLSKVRTSLVGTMIRQHVQVFQD